MTATVELRMPLGYVEVNDEEMEYLDGGAYVWSTVSSDYCLQIATILSRGASACVVASVFCGVLGRGSFAVAYAVGAILCNVGSWYFIDAARRGGINIMRTGSTRGKGLYYLQKK